MAVRVTRSPAEVLYDSSDLPVRATKIQGFAVYADRTNPVRSTRVQGQVVYADRTLPVRVTYTAVQALMSLREAVPPPPPPADLPNPKPTLLDREANPYRPSLPDEVQALDPTLYTFMREQVDIQREQHNTTQAGDSTFPWEFLTKIGPEKQFTLGSLGRFFHDDYGIILARYCQFAQMAKAKWINGPVGRLRSDDLVSWRVTNDLTKSSPDAVVGILGSYGQPEEGWYGWVLTQGANHVQLKLPTETFPSRDGQLVWSGFETVSNTGLGRVLGRALSRAERVDPTQNRIKAGGVFLDLEGPSVDSLTALLGDAFGDFEDQILAIQKALDDADFGNLVSKLNQLVKIIEDHEYRINELEANLSFTAIITRLNVLEAADELLYDRITDEYSFVDAILSGRIDDLLARVNAIPNYESRIAALEAALAGQVVKNQLIPMVDGSIPPNLVYTPDGKLVFVEIVE